MFPHRPRLCVLIPAVSLLSACSPEAPPKDSQEGGNDDGPGCATALLWVDADEDGYGDGEQPEEACINTPGHAEQSGDCDDGDPNVNPGVDEVCNGIDDDCDGTADRGLLIDVWTDADGDGFGDPATADQVCEAGAQHVRDDSDCDDTNAEVFPGADEVCNGIDDDCDEGIDDDAIDLVSVFVDEDGDGLGAPGVSFLACPGDDGIADNDWDCDDADPTTPVVVDSGSSGTGSLDAPLGTLQGGIDAAHALDGQACVLVMSGLYLEALDVSAGEVSVVGVDGAENTVVDALGTGSPALTLGAGNVADTHLSGLTLTGGTPHRETQQLTILGQRYDNILDAGAGIHAVHAVASFDDIVVADNAVEDPGLTDYTDSSGRTVQVAWEGVGGGVYVEGGSLSFEGCLLTGNQAPTGGGAYVAGGADFLHSELYSNEATTNGGAISVHEGELSVDNSIFAGNAANEAPTLEAVGADVDLEQVTVHEDALTGTFGALIQVEDSRGNWTNLILSAPASVGIRSLGTDGNIDVDGILFHQITDGWQREERETFIVANELTGDPQFVGITEDTNPTNDDLHLAATSPAVDAASSGADADGSPADLGAYGGALSDW